ncbi:MAG: hypothetical protein L3K09_00935 [Thermoplasmata archaeon]|nr:hypothetical protein [Thermoplasmata archaeon]
MSPERVVRIPRSEGGQLYGIPPKEPDPDGGFVPNAAGRTRAWRLFCLFSALLLGFYLLFLGLIATSPDPGLHQDPTLLTLLSGLALAQGLLGWWITLHVAPLAARRIGEAIEVREDFGRRREIPAPPAASVVVMRRYPGGLFGPEPTELVELTWARRGQKQYLVGPNFFESLTEGPAAP